MGAGKLAGTLVWYMLAEILRWRRGGEMNEGQGGNDLGQSTPCPSPTSRLGLHLGTWKITIPLQDQSQFVSLKQYEKINLPRPKKSGNLA